MKNPLHMKTFIEMKPSYGDTLTMDEAKQRVRSILVDQNCRYCGKRFGIRVGYVKKWLYQRSENHRPVLFCSWTCLSKFDKERKKR